MEKSNSQDTILLVWNYDRKDWIQPFLDLSTHFNFIYLSKYSAKDDKVAANTDAVKKIYWTDYSSPAGILDSIRPRAIVFMSIIHFPDIILNRAAQKRNISTVVLQHGLFYSQETYKEREKLLANKIQNKSAGASIPKSWRLKYLLSGMLQGVGIKGTVNLCRYLLQKNKFSDVTALEKNQFAERMPDKFIVYSKKNALVFKQRDGVDESDMIEIGNPTLDKYFTSEPVAKLPFENYILLVDSPLYVEKSTSSGFGFAKDKAKDIYKRIFAYAKKRDKKLVIKLHPFSYNEDNLLSDANVFYVKDEFDPKDLIANATAVISFPSTLAIPSIYFKPVLLLKFAENSFLNFISRTGLPVVSVDDISSASPDPVWNQEARQFVVEECLYIPDGRSLERMHGVFEDLCKRQK